MALSRLKEFLDANSVKYVSINHSKAFTAQEAAASAHIRGRDMAKAVVVKVDDRLAMAVLPATRKVDLDRLRQTSGAASVELAHEQDFRGDFPGCEVGAMPPFGNLFHMDVYVEPDLAKDEEIAFNAGTHTELITMPFKDFERLVHPIRAGM